MTAKYRWTDLEREIVAPGIARQVIQGTRQTLVRYWYDVGAVFPTHAHPQEQITSVLSGRIRFDIAGEQIELGPGESAVIAGSVPHGAVVIGDSPVETLNSLSPRRETAPEITPTEVERDDQS